MDAGYGKMNDGEGATVYTHRVAWMLETGEWPELPVLHRCDFTTCVRFAHLFLGTLADNNEDMVQKGRQSAKLTIERVRSIRRLLASGMLPTALAADFSVSEGTIRHIRDGRSWKHVS